MRKILTLGIASTLAATSALAQPGWYLGFQMGNADTHISAIPRSAAQSNARAVVNSTNGMTQIINGTSYVISNPTITSANLSTFKTNVDDTVVASRLFGGYQYSDFLAIEMGFLYIRDQTSKYNATGTISVSETGTAGGVPYPITVDFNSLTRTDSYNEKALDLFVKAIAPVSPKFSTYAKFGGALMRTKINSTMTLSNSSNLIVNGTPRAVPLAYSTSNSSKNTRFYPGFSIGANYQFNDTISFEGSWYKLIVDDNNMNNINILFGGVVFKLT